MEQQDCKVENHPHLLLLSLLAKLINAAFCLARQMDVTLTERERCLAFESTPCFMVAEKREDCASWDPQLSMQGISVMGRHASVDC